MSRLIRRIRYVVMIVLFLLSARYALTLRQRLGFALKQIGQVQKLSTAPAKKARANLHPEEWQPKQIGQIGAVMGDAFRTGKLPAPMSVVTDDPDRTAAELARQIALMDEHSTAALVTAIAAAGFNIRGANGDVLAGKRNAGQGIAFEAWEVTSMAKLYGDGLHTSLGDLSAAMTQTLPGFKNVPMSKLLLEGIRSDTDSKRPELRFWSRFIVELGKNADSSYDLMSPNVEAANVELDAIQFEFITRRLAADFAILGSKGAKGGKAKVSQQSWNPGCTGRLENTGLLATHRTPRLLEAVWHPRSEGQYTLAAFQEGGGAGSKLPCNLTEGQMQILDSVAYGFGIGFDRLMELLTEPGVLTEGGAKLAERYANFTLIANAVLTYAKLIITYMTVDVTIEMDSSPLIRTINTNAGCQRKLTAEIKQKIGNWQIVNCLRTALNAAGVDISLPSDGAVKKVKTQWHILAGGVSQSEARAAGYNTAIVEWVSKGAHVQDYVGDIRYSPAAGGKDFTQATTDEEGRVEVQIEGFPQHRPLEGRAVPDMKTAKVQLSFAAKPVDLKQDLIDTGAAGGLLSNPVVFLTTVPVEMILRSRWFSSPVFTVPVRDWKECSGGWSGTITYSNDGQCQNCAGYSTRNFSQRLSLSVTESGTPNSERGGMQESVYAQGELIDDVAVTFMGGGSDTDQKRASLVKVPVSLSVSADGHYAIQVVDPYSADPDSKWSCKMHLIRQDGTSKTVDGSTIGDCAALVQMHSGGIVFPPGEGTIDPNTPGKISGSKTFEFPNQGTLHWDLRYCGPVTQSCGQN